MERARAVVLFKWNELLCLLQNLDPATVPGHLDFSFRLLILQQCTVRSGLFGGRFVQSQKPGLHQRISMLQLNLGAVFNVQMSREPIPWIQRNQERRQVSAAKTPLLDVLPKVGLDFEHLLGVWVGHVHCDVGPLVRHKVVNLFARKHSQLLVLKHSRVVHRFEVVLMIRECLKVACLEMVSFVDAADSGNRDFQVSLANVEAPGRSEVVDIWGDPPAKVEISEQRRGFVISPDKDGQKWCLELSFKVQVKITQRSVFRRTSKRIQIFGVAQGLKVAAANDKVNFR